MKKLKIVFAGTSYFSAEHLKSLINSFHEVILVISQPDLPSGRGQKIIFSPVKILCLQNNIPILQPEDLKNKLFQDKLLKIHADIMIVVSYGKIIPKNILYAFPKKCINVHASLLPRWRGSTPIQSAILHGDKITGVSIITMNEIIDAGEIIHKMTCNILPKETTSSLSLKLIKIGIQALSEVLEKIISNKIVKKQQNETQTTLTKKIYKTDAQLNWNIEAKKLERLIRAFNPWPICYFKIKNINIKVWEATVISNLQKNVQIGQIISANKYGIQINTAKQILNIKKLQFPGKKIMEVKNIILEKQRFFSIGTIL